MIERIMRRISLAIAWLMVGLLPAMPAWGTQAPTPYRSPFDAKYSPDGKWLAVSDRTAGKLVIIDPARAKVVKEITVPGEPTGVAWEPGGASVFVSESSAASVAEVDVARGKITRRLQVGAGPVGLATSTKKKLLIVCNSFGDDVSVINTITGREEGPIQVIRQPSFVAVTPDETLAVVGNLLPQGDATDPHTAACVSLIDLNELRKVKDVRLPGGSSSCRQIVISTDSRWAYAVHTIGRTQRPTTEIEEGWINVNALSIIDLQRKVLAATVLLDRLTEGAANPWGIALSPDGKDLWVSLAGVHQLARIDRERLHDFVEGRLSRTNPALGGPGVRPGSYGASTKGSREVLMQVMSFAPLYLDGVITRTPLPGNGPRGLSISPEGNTLAVPMYYSGGVVLMDAMSDKVVTVIPLGAPTEMDKARQGEEVFHDASYCLQHWLSCATCHPDGRTDGLHWDLLNDGIGNPKHTHSLLFAHKTPPMMSLGVRSNMEAAVVAGFRYIEFHEPTQEEVETTQEYIQSLQPVRSPQLLPNGELSPAAKRGTIDFLRQGGLCELPLGSVVHRFEAP
jgi:DNA-binding beta-propeller fold protein YncE